MTLAQIIGASSWLRYARDCSTSSADEIADRAPDTAGYARVALAQMRGRLESLERDRHAERTLTPINPAGLPAAYAASMGFHWTGYHLQRDGGIVGAIMVILIVLAILLFA